MDNEILRILQDIYSQNNGYQDDVIHIYLQGLLTNTNIIKESAQQLAKVATDPNNPQQAMVKILEEHRKDDNRREVETRNRRIAEDQRTEELNKKQEASNKLQEQQIKNDANYHKELKNTIKESNTDWKQKAIQLAKDVGKMAIDGTFQMAGAMVGNAERAGQAMMHLTSFGVNMENGAEQFNKITKGGITSIDTFTQMVSDNAGYISRLNAQGESGVVSFRTALEEIVPKIKNLGFNTEEQAKAVKAYLDNQKITRQFENLSQKERQAHMLNYMEQVDKLSHMMGVSREEIEKRLSLEKAESWVKMAANNPAMKGQIELLRGMGIDSKKIAAIMGMPQIAGSEAMASMIKAGESPLIGLGRNTKNADELGRALSQWAKTANKGTSETAMTFANAGIGWSDIATQVLNYNPNTKGGATGDTQLAIEVHNAKENIEILNQSLGLTSELFQKNLRETRDYFKDQFDIQKAGIDRVEETAKNLSNTMSLAVHAVNNLQLSEVSKQLNLFSGKLEGYQEALLNVLSSNTSSVTDLALSFGTSLLGTMGGNALASGGKKLASKLFTKAVTKNVAKQGMKEAVKQGGKTVAKGVSKAAGPLVGAAIEAVDGISNLANGDYRGASGNAGSLGLHAISAGLLMSGVGAPVAAALEIANIFGAGDWLGKKVYDWTSGDKKKDDELLAQAQEQIQTQDETYENLYAVLSDIKNLLSGIQKVEVVNRVKVSSGAMGTV